MSLYCTSSHECQVKWFSCTRTCLAWIQFLINKDASFLSSISLTFVSITKLDFFWNISGLTVKDSMTNRADWMVSLPKNPPSTKQHYTSNCQIDFMSQFSKCSWNANFLTARFTALLCMDRRRGPIIFL